MMATTQRKAIRLLAIALHQEETGREAYKRSGKTFDEAIALGLPIGEPIELPARRYRGRIVAPARTVRIKNNFATDKPALYRPARLPKFEIEDVKPEMPPTRRAKNPRAVASAVSADGLEAAS
jgi:hypothetical protein